MMSNIVIVDYGMGNLFSLMSAFRKIGYSPTISKSHEELTQADVIVLPGVGSFPKAMACINKLGLKRIIIDHANAGKKLLGICLGHQLLFEGSEELGGAEGLGLLGGRVVSLANVAKVEMILPHIGWRQVLSDDYDPLFAAINKDMFYFTHTFAAHPDKSYSHAITSYNSYPFCAAIKHSNIVGFQFHPEKSREAGLRLLHSSINKEAEIL